MVKFATWAVALVILSACKLGGPYGVESPYYQYPGPVYFVLNHSLDVEPDSATVRLQSGQVVPRNGVQEQYPYCIFELSTVSDGVQHVAPGEFQVTSVRWDVSTIAGNDLEDYGFIRVGMGGGQSSPTNYYYKTIFLLHSDQQPTVLSMTCQSNQNYTPVKRYLTVAEIRQALGNIFTLVLPPTGS